MQQAKFCTAVGSPVAVQLAGCKGRVLLSPGLGQGGPPFHLRPWSKRRGWYRTLFEAKVWPGGASPAGP